MIPENRLQQQQRLANARARAMNLTVVSRRTASITAALTLNRVLKNTLLRRRRDVVRESNTQVVCFRSKPRACTAAQGISVGGRDE